MHEILAIVLWMVDLDSLETEGPLLQDTTDEQASVVLSRQYVEHDAFVLFNIMMSNMLSWYDPNPTVALPASTAIPGSSPSPSPSSASLVQPIVAKCARIHDLLRKVDFDLWKRMEELKIEPQIYGIRWTRLLFSREFPMEDV